MRWKIALLGLLAAGACAPLAAPVVPCNQDSECAATQQCRDGVCVVSPGGGLDPGSADAGAPLDEDAGALPSGADAGTAPDAGEAVVDAGQGDAGVEWHLSAWRRRVPLSVRWSGAPESDFPALVVLDPEQVAALSASDGGADLRVVSADGEPLPHELARFDENGAALWVRVPRLEDGARLFLYAKNAAAVEATDTAYVWSGGFRSVWHLEDDAHDAMGGTDGAPGLGVTFEAGAAGRAARFDGASRIDLGQALPHAQGAEAVTFSLWLMRDGDVDAELLSLSAGEPSAPNHSRVALALEPGGNLKLFGREEDGASARGVSAEGVIPSGRWLHVAGVFDVAAQSLQLFVDGAEMDTVGYGGPFTRDRFPDTPSPFGSIGSDDDGAGFYFVGALDEVRVSNVARSPGWIAAEHASLGGGLMEVGAVEVRP